MATFHCSRFPLGAVPIRTEAGVVEFQDGKAEVGDAKLAAALRKVPEVFGITEDRPPAKKRATRKPAGKPVSEAK